MAWRLLVTPFPTKSSIHRRSKTAAQFGGDLPDCHTNGHTSGSFHITPDIRPEQRRIRLDTVGLVACLRINRFMGRSEAYVRSRISPSLNSVPLTSMAMRFTRSRRHEHSGLNRSDEHGQMQNMFDFPPAPKLTVTGWSTRRSPPLRSAARDCSSGKRNVPPAIRRRFISIAQMHDLHVEQFLKTKTRWTRSRRPRCGYQGQPPYLHDGRALTLEDTVEFFNLVLELKLTPEEKHNLVQFMRQL